MEEHKHTRVSRNCCRSMSRSCALSCAAWALSFLRSSLATLSASLRASSLRSFSIFMTSISLMYSFRTSFTCNAYSLRRRVSFASASLGSRGASQLPRNEFLERNSWFSQCFNALADVVENGRRSNERNMLIRRKHEWEVSISTNRMRATQDNWKSCKTKRCTEEIWYDTLPNRITDPTIHFFLFSNTNHSHRASSFYKRHCKSNGIQK